MGVGVTALVVLAVIAAVVALQFTRELLVPVIIGILISYVLDPLVNGLIIRQVPRWIAATCVFLLVLVVVVGGAYGLREQTATLIARLPSAAQEVREAVQRQIGGTPGPIAQV